MKSLNVKIMSYQKNNGFDAQKFGHILEIIKNNFPMNSEVTVEFIGNMKALIEKKEGENLVLANKMLEEAVFSICKKRKLCDKLNLGTNKFNATGTPMLPLSGI